MQKRLNDIGWSDVKKCRGCNKEEGTEKHKLYFSSGWLRGTTSCEGANPKSTKVWGIPVEGFRDHVASDGSLLGGRGEERGGFRQVKRMRAVGGAARSRRADGTNAWDVQNAGCGA